jgi:ABC-type multidrug transport system fused ATPase/permease subunit
MVLDAGHLVEYATPSELLRKDGLLKALVDESADKDVLYAIANGKAS